MLKRKHEKRLDHDPIKLKPTHGLTLYSSTMRRHSSTMRRRSSTMRRPVPAPDQSPHVTVRKLASGREASTYLKFSTGISVPAHVVSAPANVNHAQRNPAAQAAPGHGGEAAIA